MPETWRRLALAAAIYVTVGAGVAAAQTVIVRNAPPGSPVELSYNDKSIASAAADERGLATLPVNLQANAGRQEVDLHIFVDLCPKQRVVRLVQPGLVPPAQADGCDRREIPGVFLVKGITSLVVDLSGEKPAVWLRQGPAPPHWLSEDLTPSSEGPRRLAPTGFVLFGGSGLNTVNNVVAEACGDEADCSGKSSRLAFDAGAGVWITRYLGAQVRFMRPSTVKASGTATNYRFETTFDPKILALAGTVGVPIGPVRIYGQAGVNYHRATLSTTQTIDDSTITIDDTTVTVKGGTETLEVPTSGWGWLFGGGMEGWVSNWMAIYAEGGRLRLKGNVRGTGDPTTARDDRTTYIVAGLRVRLGR